MTILTTRTAILSTDSTRDLLDTLNSLIVGNVSRFATKEKGRARTLAAFDEFAPKASAKGTSRSESMALSWQDPEIAAKRTTRHAVSVDGERFSSLAKAFIAKRLNWAKLIPTRMELKEKGKLVFEGHKMKIVD